MNVLTYDIEIKKSILMGGETRQPGIEYCGGWNDKAGMGISYLGAHNSADNTKHYFTEDRLLDFIEMIKHADLVTGYNIHGFDTPLLKATLNRLGHSEETGMKGKCYDVFWDIKKSLGNMYPKGWTLDNVVKSTLGIEKNGSGAMAPILYQQGKLNELRDYLSQDLECESRLYEHVACYGWVSNEAAGCHRLNLQGISKFTGIDYHDQT